jgi:hypothetical protein
VIVEHKGASGLGGQFSHLSHLFSTFCIYGTGERGTREEPVCQNRSSTSNGTYLSNPKQTCFEGLIPSNNRPAFRSRRRHLFNQSTLDHLPTVAHHVSVGGEFRSSWELGKGAAVLMGYRVRSDVTATRGGVASINSNWVLPHIPCRSSRGSRSS